MPTIITNSDKGLGEVILRAYKRGFSLQSDFFRQNADYVAMAASLGLLSTKVYGNVFSREWRPTVRGLQFIERVFGKHLEPDGSEPDGNDPEDHITQDYQCSTSF